ncbi:MAG: GNAT family N-acetyltransferase [Desulfobacterales bacterium]|jgi:ribosomal protein S18 acetylase RimI-like enzyme
MNIRHFRRSDRPQIAAVQIESWKDTYAGVLPAAYLANQVAAELKHHWSEVEIQPEDIVRVAEDDGIIGFISVWCRPDPFIDNLHVKPAMRSKGIGSKLMASAARQMIRQGHGSAYLWVFEKNQRAIQLYERLGGIRTEHAVKNIFGHKLPSVKMVWSDISVLCPNTI